MGISWGTYFPWIALNLFFLFSQTSAWNGGLIVTQPGSQLAPVGKKGKSSNQKGGTTDDFDFGLIDFDSQLPDSQLNMTKFDSPCFVRLSNYIGYSD
jgi:hypothetical protein